MSSSLQVQLAIVYRSILRADELGKKTLAIEIPGVCKQIGMAIPKIPILSAN